MLFFREDAPRDTGADTTRARGRPPVPTHRGNTMPASRSVACALALSSLAASPALAVDNDPWADAVVSYDAGTNAQPGFTNPFTALGRPERFTGEALGFPGSVTPFASAFGTDEIVSVGAGGHLTLRFDTAVTDDASNDFGIDLILYGNSFFNVDDFFSPNPVVTGTAADGGTIELSADGINWVTVPGLDADGALPTLGYADETNPFGGPAGAIATDFRRAVDPSFDPVGLTFSEIVAGYNGAAGGTGIDIGALGLSSVSFIRISNPFDATANIEIDAVVDAIPSPGSITLLLGAPLLAGRRRR